MIFDAYGREMRRSIGFASCLRAVVPEKRTVDLVAGATVDLEETYEPIEECKRVNDKPTKDSRGK